MRYIFFYTLLNHNCRFRGAVCVNNIFRINIIVSNNLLFRFSYFNIRSILPGFDLFSEALNSECSYDVVGLLETWLNADTANTDIGIQGYNICRRNRGTRGGGVAIYVRDCIPFKVVDLVGNGGSLLVQLWISVKVGGKKLCLGTLYRPPNVNLNGSLDELENVLIDLIPRFDGIVFGGDFNIDLLASNNNGAQLVLNLLHRYDLNQWVQDPTRRYNQCISNIT